MSESKINTSEDDERDTMKWKEEHEKYLLHIRQECVIKIQIIANKINDYKKIYYFLNISNIILPVALASINPFLVAKYKIISSLGTGMITIISGVNTWHNTGSKIEKHKDFLNKYNDLIDEIDLILLKSKKFRLNVDLTLEQIKNKLENINNLFDD